MYEPAQVNQPAYQELNLKEEGKFSFIPWYIWLFLAVLAVTIILLLIYFLVPGLKERINKSIGQQKNVAVVVTPSPIPILGGTQTYTISGGTKGLPQITQLTLDPQDPEVGQTQTISVAANNGTPIKEVIVVLHLDDDKEFEYKLSQSEGTPTHGTWKTAVPFPYSYNTTYRVTVKARNESNLGNMTTISIR
jgi:heme/copper-type cytochrome/quinol oxidase subunit 2